MTAVADDALPASEGDRTLRLAAGASVVVLALSFALLVFPPRAHDDAFITYRYARNIAEGRGFVYNAGEPVLGTSSPLYALLMAAGVSLGAVPPWWSAAVELLAVVALSVILLAHFRALGAPYAGAAVVLALAIQRRILESTLGMESCLYTTLAVGMLVAAGHGWWRTALALAGPVTLIRPEGFLAVAACLVAPGVARMLRRDAAAGSGFGRGHVAAAALSLGLVGAWTAYAWITFGSPVPTTIAAKAAQFRDPSRLRFVDFVFDTYVVGGSMGALDPPFRLLGLGALAGAIVAVLRVPPARGVVAWIVLYLAVFARAPHYRWYEYPLMVGATVCVGYLLMAAGLRRGQAARPTAVRLALVLALFLALFAREAVVSARVALVQAQYLAAAGTDDTYRRVGLWLREHTAPSATVASHEIGKLGYYSERRIFDLEGLVSPKALQFANGDGVARALDFEPAEYLVLKHRLPPHAPLVVGARGAVYLPVIADADPRPAVDPTGAVIIVAYETVVYARSGGP